MSKKLSCSMFFIILIAFSFTSCRKDSKVVPEETTNTLFPAEANAAVTGLYLVNEGNMFMNKASLDYVDFNTGSYRKNIYNQANPEVTKGLGDVGNDVGVYGSKLYVVVNGSNKVEVLNVKTGKRIQQIDIINCRYITFSKGKAYVSAYLGQIGDPKAPNGIVAEIDTALLKETKRVEVGRQPEEMAVVGNNLYIANSGGYTPGNYERTISVIDLGTFKETRRIPVAVNLHRLKADRYGDLYVTSRGDYLDVPSKLYVIDTRTDQVKKIFDVAASNIVIDDDFAYIYSSSFNIITGQSTVSYDMINVKEEVLLSRKFITDGTEKIIKVPYGIAVHPINKDVFVTDATDYVTPGVLYCFDSTGKKKWSIETGDIPAQFAFVYK
ncbi:MAG: YncE family protein [Pedobacter sp.]|nr:MAG: YncE family protein [Pedobacter sp.]